MNHPTRLLFAGLAGLVPALGAGAGPGTHTDHEINLYSIEQYGELYDPAIGANRRWKNTVLVSSAKDPYDDFWDSMVTDCSGGSECARYNSVARKNEEVTVESMTTYPGWESPDMVFFYGHNTMIQPQWDHDFDVWHSWGPDYELWTQEPIGDWTEWGTPAEPYRYHADWVDDASLYNSYAVFYAYNPLTSVLVGQDFVDDYWVWENTWDQPTADLGFGRLGPETEWVIGHGCNALTVAKYQNNVVGGAIVGSSLGVNAWKKSWDRLHLVLGHYYLTDTYREPDLNPFAADLKAGDHIVDAYFDAHTAGIPGDPAYAMPAAMTQSPSSCCINIDIGWWHFLYCPQGGCNDDFMHSETWTAPMSDVTGNDYFYATSWKEYEE